MFTDHIWSLHFPDVSFFDQTGILNLGFRGLETLRNCGIW